MRHGRSARVAGQRPEKPTLTGRLSILGIHPQQAGLLARQPQGLLQGGSCPRALRCELSASRRNCMLETPGIGRVLEAENSPAAARSWRIEREQVLTRKAHRTGSHFVAGPAAEHIGQRRACRRRQGP